jgi:hypothetical protein
MTPHASCTAHSGVVCCYGHVLTWCLTTLCCCCCCLLLQPILEEVRAEKMERMRLGSGPGYQRTIP